jgi:hypothetical protein
MRSFSVLVRTVPSLLRIRWWKSFLPVWRTSLIFLTRFLRATTAAMLIEFSDATDCRVTSTSF